MQGRPDSNIIIRSARASDAELLKALEKEAGLSPWSIEDYRNEAERDGSIFLVAHDHGPGLLVGFLLVRLIMLTESHQSDSQFNFEAEILNLAVSKTYRRQRIATALLQAALEEIPSRTPGVLHLEVRASNDPAIRFYKSEGFSVVGRRRGFYSDPREDALLLRLEF